jgi:hypothetical protein
MNTAYTSLCTWLGKGFSSRQGFDIDVALASRTPVFFDFAVIHLHEVKQERWYMYSRSKNGQDLGLTESIV